MPVETEWSSLIKRIVRVTRDVLQCSAKIRPVDSTGGRLLCCQPAIRPPTGNAIRGHWHIENKLHYTRDVTFQEDQSRIRHNPGIFARLRSFAYNILQRNRTSTFSQERYAAASASDALLKWRFS